MQQQPAAPTLDPESARRIDAVDRLPQTDSRSVYLQLDMVRMARSVLQALSTPADSACGFPPTPAF